MKISFFDLKSQYDRYNEEIEMAIENALKSSQFLSDPKAQVFEEELEKFTGARDVICCSNGKNALLLSLIALDVRENDEIITSAFGSKQVAEVIKILKAKPVFVDIEKDTYNINHRLIEEKITPKTKAIIPLSIYGQCADLDEINEIALRHNLAVIEDATQSLGSSYKELKSCGVSVLAFTSFFPSKPLGSYGDGGAIFTNDFGLGSKIRVIFGHLKSADYKEALMDFGKKLDPLQIAILRVKLQYFKEEIEARKNIAKIYDESLKDIVATPYIKDDRTSVYAHYVIRVNERLDLINKLEQSGIPTQIHYPKPIPFKKGFHSLGYKKGDFPVSEKVSKELLSLPMGAFLKQDTQEYIIEKIKEAIR